MMAREVGRERLSVHSCNGVSLCVFFGVKWIKGSIQVAGARFTKAEILFTIASSVISDHAHCSGMK
jgi:hypothetical protein